MEDERGEGTSESLELFVKAVGSHHADPSRPVTDGKG